MRFPWTRGYSPDSLGLPFPEIKRIYLKKCGTNGPHKDSLLPHSTYLAHTHMCPEDSLLRSICIADKAYLQGEPDFVRVILHEYAHVLDVKHQTNCTERYTWSYDEIKNYFHSIEYWEIHRRLEDLYSDS